MAQEPTVTKVASAREPKLAYQSIFTSYRAYKDQTPASWREVNQAVAPAVGGSKPSDVASEKGEKEQTPGSSAAPHSKHH